MAHADALVIESFAVVTPCKASAWLDTLKRCNLLQKYPNIVHDITHGAPIGNPPLLTSTFIPKNMPSASKHANIIDEYLAEEIEAGRMSASLTIEQARTFFGGHFRTAPMGVVEQDGKFRVIHNHSALDSEGVSTNSWLDASENPTKFYTAAQFADAVSLLLHVVGYWRAKLSCHFWAKTFSHFSAMMFSHFRLLLSAISRHVFEPFPGYRFSTHFLVFFQFHGLSWLLSS